MQLSPPTVPSPAPSFDRAGVPAPARTPARRPLRRLLRGPTRRARVPVVLLAVLTLLAAMRPGVAQDGAAPPFGIEEGRTALDFTMLALDGSPVTLSDLRGRPVLINFWASWCPPCVDELPLLDEAAGELDGRLHTILLNVGEPHDVVAPFLAELGVASPIVLRDARDRERPLPEGVVASRNVAQAYQTFGLPTSLLIDADGVIRARISGPIDDAMLQRLLADVGLDRSP